MALRLDEVFFVSSSGTLGKLIYLKNSIYFNESMKNEMTKYSERD